MAEYLYHPYWLYGYRELDELDMPRLSDNLLHCVIYTYRSTDEGIKSKNIGGSGFIVGVQSKIDPSRSYPYAVTNAHVVDEGGTFIRLNKRDGTMDFIVKGKNDWTSHPDGSDIAVTPLGTPLNGLDQTKHRIDFHVSDAMFISKETLEQEDIGIGDEAFIIGRFQVAEGKLQNTPTLRWGTIAQMPLEPIAYRKGMHKMYLVECHSVSGFSGSPVFSFVDYMQARPNSDSVSPQTQIRFLGIDCGHLPIDERGVKYNEKGKWKSDNSLKVVANSAMMAVVPAWKLRELLDLKELKGMRDEADKRLQKKVEQKSSEEKVIPDSLAIDETDFKETLKKVSRRTNLEKPDSSKPKT